MKSIRFQAGRVVNTALPTQQEILKVRTKLVQEMRAAGSVHLPPLHTREQVVAAVNHVLESGELNPKATPGYPFDRVGRTKEAVLEKFRGSIRDSAVDLIENWKSVGRDNIKRMSVPDLMKAFLVYPTQAKIKQEPHAREKLEQQRYRIFFAVSMVHEIVTRVLYGNVINREADNWRTLPVKPGIGFTDEMVKDLYQHVDSLGESREDNDGSGYDWSQRQWVIDLVTQATIEAYCIDSCRAELMRIDVYLSYKTPWLLSDGTLLEVYFETEAGREWLVWKSGRFTTARDNSWGRITLAHLAALRLDKLELSWAVTMGDDCVESDLDRDYSQFGIRITDRNKSKRGEPFTFCSHEIRSDGKARLIPWGKTLYRLLSNRPDWEFVYQFEYELRHNSELSKIQSLLWDIGYYKTLGYQPHCRAMGVCILPQNSIMKGQAQRPKGMPKKEWAALNKGQKARFLDFNIHTNNVNSGSQQYGAGQTMRTLPKAKIAKTIKLAKSSTRTVQPGLVNGGQYPVITETEMIGNVTVDSNGFEITNQFVVQPGIPVDPDNPRGSSGSCFQFIVPMAQLYEKYELLALKFTYKPLVSVFSDGGKAGQVVMSYSYDALSGPPQDIIKALATQPHVEGMANQALSLVVNCREAMQGGKYTRNSVVPAGDMKTYDAGRLFVCVDGIPVTSEVVGQIMVTYSVRLLNPRPGGNITPPPNYQFSFWQVSKPLAFSGTTATTAFDLSGAAFSYNPLGVLTGPINNPAPSGPIIGFILPRGCWLVIATFSTRNTGNGSNMIMYLSQAPDSTTLATEYLGTATTAYSPSGPAGTNMVFPIHQETGTTVFCVNGYWATNSTIGNQSIYASITFMAA